MEVLKTIDLNKTFKIKSLKISAVENFNIEINRTDFFALVGESGSGKSTVAKLLTRLIKPESGRIFFKENDIWKINGDDLKNFRKSIGLVFQDSYASLNPRMKIIDIVQEPLKIHKKFKVYEIKSKVNEILKNMGIDEVMFERYPHQLSGGQRQRVAISRALILEPELLIADEPLSALDISLQASILNQIIEIKKTREMGILLITHDLNIVRAVSNRLAVMHLGRIVEEGQTKSIFSEPLHPYTKKLLNSIPDFQRRNRPKIAKISTENKLCWILKGCRFFYRCDYRMDICKDNVPQLKEIKNRKVRCFLY
ncbi:MAG: ABC transporter ATP-binding protein [Thermodesulfovibrio sp.]|nr:ABC transporter ATP-binding protein [Thermodesulfovibrio sp.]MDW7998534.1 ABC transporter ATP-binding protein [Thermodesulfovibrio sp.]